MAKYDRLRVFLDNAAATQKEITLSLFQIEVVLGETLPDSSREYRQWWANEVEGTHIHAKAWIETGWKVKTVDPDFKTVTFSRV